MFRLRFQSSPPARKSRTPAAKKNGSSQTRGAGKQPDPRIVGGLGCQNGCRITVWTV